MSLRSRLAIAALSLVCATGAAPHESALDAPSATLVAQSAATVVIVDAGAEPRQLLRYDLANLQLQALAMDVAMTMDMNTPFGPMSTALPIIRSVTRVTGVTPTERGATVAMVIERFEVLPREGVDPMMMQALQPIMSQISNISGTMEIDSRGNVLSSSFEAPNADPVVQQQIQSMEESLRQIAVPLPEEPVGVGARWEANMTVESGGMRIEQRAAFRIEDISAESLRLSTSVSQTAAAQNFADPNTGMQMTLNSMTGSGSGTSTVRFDSVVPTANANMSVSMSMSSPDPAMAAMGELSMSMTMEISATPM